MRINGRLIQPEAKVWRHRVIRDESFAIPSGVTPLKIVEDLLVSFVGQTGFPTPNVAQDPVDDGED